MLALLEITQGRTQPRILVCFWMKKFLSTLTHEPTGMPLRSKAKICGSTELHGPLWKTGVREVSFEHFLAYGWQWTISLKSHWMEFCKWREAKRENNTYVNILNRITLFHSPHTVLALKYLPSWELAGVLHVAGGWKSKKIHHYCYPAHHIFTKINPQISPPIFIAKIDNFW